MQFLGYVQVVVDIYSCFLFECVVFEKWVECDLIFYELCELMMQVQCESYGDVFVMLYFYMWVVKLYYYGLIFYNYFYIFGLLFGFGLYVQYEQVCVEGNVVDFQCCYDELFFFIGFVDVCMFVVCFGIDLYVFDFWEGSLNVICCQIDEYECVVS